MNSNIIVKTTKALDAEYTRYNASTGKLYAIVHEEYPFNPRADGLGCGISSLLIADLGRNGYYSDKGASLQHIWDCVNEIDQTLTSKIDKWALDENADERLKLFKAAQKANVWVTDVYAYVHSGTTFSLSPFNDPWDSGRAGYMYMTPKMAKNFGCESYQQFEQWAANELEVLNQYLSGDTWSIVIFENVEVRENGIMVVDDSYYDSYGGYYGIESAKAEVDSYCETEGE